MKIRTKLTLRYSIVTAAILLLFSAIVYIAMEHRREREFFNDLKKEAGIPNFTRTKGWEIC